MSDAQVEIYAICEPMTGKVMYIGKAKCSKKRLCQHMLEKRRKSPLYSWLAEIKKAGQYPVLKIIEKVHKDYWADAEKKHIKHYRENGGLLNLAKGGNQPYCPPDICAENGRKNAKAIHSHPKRRRIWELKKAIGQAIKSGELKERHKVKLRMAAKNSPELFGEYANL